VPPRLGRMGDASQVSPLKDLLRKSIKDDALPSPHLRAERASDARSDEPDLKQNRDKAKVRARDSAIRLLARREHARAEIKQKLRLRGVDDQLATEVVDDLTRQRLLSDERFAEVFVRSRAERGQGPVRLRAELRQLKLSPELIDLRVRSAQVDWSQLASQIRQRKFGSKLPKVPAERAKQMRFLQYRGFTAEQIRRAMGASFEEDHLLDADDSDSLESGVE
jgi:regulatory protein